MIGEHIEPATSADEVFQLINAEFSEAERVQSRSRTT
jgi:hypothetical protein